MRIGLFGGSFDPIHAGHVSAVKEARAVLGLDRVIYLPTARPPHKLDRRMAPAHARLVMVELALLHEDGLEVSPFELREDGEPAYTVDTLEHYAGLYPEAELFLLLGVDAVVELPTWRRWERILELAVVGALSRPGQVSLSGATAALEEALAAGRIRLLSNQSWDLSSSEIRRLLRRGEDPPAGALPSLVLDYIRKYGHYR